MLNKTFPAQQVFSKNVSVTKQFLPQNVFCHKRLLFTKCFFAVYFFYKKCPCIHKMLITKIKFLCQDLNIVNLLLFEIRQYFRQSFLRTIIIKVWYQMLYKRKSCWKIRKNVTILLNRIKKARTGTADKKTNQGVDKTPTMLKNNNISVLFISDFLSPFFSF